MFTVIGVKFRNIGKVYYFDPKELTVRYNDHVMLALRTCEGLDLSTLDSDERSYCEETAKKFVLDGLLVKTDNHLRLSRKGLFVSDMIMSELMKA